MKAISVDPGLEKARLAKKVRKPRVDMGVPPAARGAETQASAGSVFDPARFKGNVALSVHFNEVSHSMLRQPITNISPSVEHGRSRKCRFGGFCAENYNTALPAEDQEQLEGSNSDAAAQDIEEEDFNYKALRNLNRLPGKQQAGDSAQYNPGFDQEHHSRNRA